MKKIQSILIGSLFTIAMFFSLPWVNNTFVIGLNPFVGCVVNCLILVITAPIVFWCLRQAKIVGRGNIGFTPAILFAIGFVSWFISGIFFTIFKSKLTLDFQTHDTYYVITLNYVMTAVALFFAILGGIYHWYPKISGRSFNNTLAKIHFWITFSGSYFILWPSQNGRLTETPGRYINFSTEIAFSQFGSFSQYETFNRFYSIIVIAIIVAQLMFLFNLLYSLLNGRKATS